MLRRLAFDQPDSFEFTPENRAWAEAQIRKYPEGRQASAIIPLLWRAQEQEGWLTKPAIEHVAGMLGMAHIRALEVATFYFMFQLQPVGSLAHVQVCGTTPCMLCGSEELIAVCREKIAAEPHQLSGDARFSWEEVECLGACANAPMVQIGKDFYEDLDAESFGAILDAFAAGEVPEPGSRKGRFASEPEGGLTSLTALERTHDANASVTLARAKRDTIARITGAEVPEVSPPAALPEERSEIREKPEPLVVSEAPVSDQAITREESDETAMGRPEADIRAEADVGARPEQLSAPREGGPDDLKRIKGIGPKLEAMLHGMGFFHFDQLAAWTETEIAWVNANLTGFHGRVTRDDWVAQARILAGGGSTAFSNRVKKGDVY